MLPDYLAAGLRVVFVGTAVGVKSAERGHYYAGPGNEFWRFLFASGLTPAPLGPEDDSTLPSLGLGLTDLVKNLAQSNDRGLPYDVPTFNAKVTHYQPEIVAFTSMKGGEVYARSIGAKVHALGLGDWLVEGRPAFVLPSPSAANRTPTNPPRVEWWKQLGRLASAESFDV
jgi:TDG/mug DNA glycosylase family protein